MRVTVTLPQAVQGLALIAVVAGLATWGRLLLAPAAPLPASDAVSVEAPTGSAAAQWFASLPAAVEIKVTGLLASRQGAVAIITLNGGPAQAVRAGAQLAPGVRLVAIEPQGLLIERGDQRSQIRIAQLPQGPQLPRLTRP